MKPDKTFDFDDFANTVSIAIIALNNVLDEGLPLHPLQEQRESVHDWRQIGLGIMGLADMLIRMGVRYGSKESIDICDMIGHKMAYKAIETSSELSLAANPYPNFDYDAVSKSAYSSKHTSDDMRRDVASNGLRNSQLLTIAPTGTLSTMLGISGGIEPIYANYYTRKTESLYGHDEYYKVYTPIVKSYMEEHGLSDDSQLPEYFVTAQNLNYKERIDMQAIWQSHIDASISSTVNVPNSFTVKETEDLYMYAWEKGLKGVTIFRDGCKRTGILSTNDAKDKPKETNPAIPIPVATQDMIATTDQLRPVSNVLPRGVIIKADDNCIGKKRTLRTGCGTLHCEAFFDPSNGQLLETYFSKGSEGGCGSFMCGLSRMISLAARGGVDIYSIVDQLKSTSPCPSYAVRTATKHDTSKGSCCPVAIGNALIDMYKELQDELFCGEDVEEYDGWISETKTEAKVETKTEIKTEMESVTTPENPAKARTITRTENGINVDVIGEDMKCPQCGGQLVFEGGCNTCKECGWSRCD